MNMFSEDWHGVPTGTEVCVIGEYVDIQGSRVLIVARADSKNLPCPWDHNGSQRAHVAPEFIAEQVSA